MTTSPLAVDTTDPVRPGLMVVHGNHLEDLRDLLVEWLAHAPLAPLEDEVLLVQSNGIAQWLKLALARPRDAGGMGISAAVDMQLPGRFLWQAYRAVLGKDAVAADSPFDKSRLTWRLMRVLPRRLAQPAFAPLRHFLGDQVDTTRLFQLAGQVADLFDQYQVYRADWLDDWAHGRDQMRNDLRGTRTPLDASERWQAELWRALLDDVGPGQRESHRAAVHRAFMQRVAALAERPAAMPRRVVVFGISSLPQQTLEALTALGRIAQVFLVVGNPCRHYWGDIIEDRELLRAERHRHGAKPGVPAVPRFEDLHAQANPLLAAWGKQGRDYIRLLDAFDQPEAYRGRLAALGRDIDLFSDPGRDTLLHQVQHAILELEPLPAPAARTPLVAGDDSLRFHVTHNAQREVEVLHDNLLAMFEAAQARGTPLAPRDVMVMVPDIDTYAPHIQAVFGRLAPDDPRHLPCSIADRPARGSTPLLTALDYLLRLPTARCTASEVLDLLDTPALRRRFAFRDDDALQLRQWIEGAGIRWGLSGTQKEHLGVPALEQNTWQFGLRRMLLGYAVGDGALLDGIAPYPEIGGLDAALVGPLARLIDRLEHHAGQLATPASPQRWVARLRTLLDDFFEPGRDDGDAVLLQRLRDALAEWEQTCDDAGFDAPLPIDVAREHWLAAVDASRLSQRFLGGAVSFGTLLPMRAIPFRVVCLLGMNDGDYPRRHDAPDFDLMAARDQQRPGDRSRREDDRYLFLEALLAAREHLYVSWVGRSERDNAPLPPSVLVGQLRDYLAAGWKGGQGHFSEDRPPASTTTESDSDPLSLLTTEYPLQAFSSRYFTAAPEAEARQPFTYAHEWQRARAGAAAPIADAPLPSWQPEDALDIAFLQRFLKAPAKTFYAARFGARFGNVAGATADDEPFALDGLERHTLTAELALAGMTDGEPALATTAATLAAQGRLPAGGFGDRALAAATAAAGRIATAWQTLAARWPTRLPPQAIRHAAAGLAIDGWLDDLRQGDAGWVRLVATASTLVDAKTDVPRHDKLLDAWVVHLLANTVKATSSILIGADATLQLPPLAPDAAAAQLHALFAAVAEGMCQPLPIARRTAFAWLIGPAESAPSRARARYDRGAYVGQGEVADDACLAREWPDFAALHAAGFERWLHLYAPLVAAVNKREASA